MLEKSCNLFRPLSRNQEVGGGAWEQGGLDQNYKALLAYKATVYQTCVRDSRLQSTFRDIPSFVLRELKLEN